MREEWKNIKRLKMNELRVRKKCWSKKRRNQVGFDHGEDIRWFNDKMLYDLLIIK